MKKTEKQLRAFIREEIDYVIKQPNLVKRSLPHTYQHWYTKNAPNLRKPPEEYLSDEQKEKYGEKLAKLRKDDPHQTDTLVRPLIGDDEPPGFYDKSKGYTEEMEMIARIHDDEVPNPDGPGTVSRRSDNKIPPFMLNLRGYTNKEMRILFRLAKDIYTKAVNERDAKHHDLGNDARARRMSGYFDEDMQDRTGLYKYLLELVYDRDVVAAANNLKRYITDKDYENERKDLASFPDGQHVLKQLRNTIKSLEKQYRDAMKYYHYGTMPREDNNNE